MDRNLIEFKTFDFELKEVSDKENEGKIEGYASTFGNMDQGFDIVEKGAFKKTVKDLKGKWPVLADHMPMDQIGWNESAVEDDHGLFTVSSLTLEVQKAREKYALAKKAKEIGARMGLSIGYSVIKSEPDNANTRIRRLKELKMWEHSIVTFPMNTEALITSAKAVGSFDKAVYLIRQLKQNGISLKDLEMALQKEAADVDQDPTKICQSIENLIQKFKS